MHRFAQSINEDEEALQAAEERRERLKAIRAERAMLAQRKALALERKEAELRAREARLAAMRSNKDAMMMGDDDDAVDSAHVRSQSSLDRLSAAEPESKAPPRRSSHVVRGDDARARARAQ